MKKLKLVTKILLIIIICLVGFVGLYFPWEKPTQMNNKIKDFTLSKDLKGYREIIFKLSDANKVLDKEKNVIGDTDSYDDDAIKQNSYTKSEEKVNVADSLTVENYEKSKSIIEKRLVALDVQDYNISLDKNTGSIYLQIPEDDKTDKVVSNIIEKGGIELKDSEDSSKVFLTNDHFKEAKYFYNTGETGTSTYLELQFNDEGKDVLKNLSENDYKTLPKKESTEESNTTDNNETNSNETKKEETKKNDKKETEKNDEKKEEEKQKQVALYMSGSQITTMNFDEPIVEGKIDLTMGTASKDEEKINESLNSAKTVCATLNNGPLPLKYNAEKNQYVKTDIKESSIKSLIIVVAVCIGILLIYMVIKYKAKGILATISYIGFLALYIMALRVFNVAIALEGILGIIIVLGLNYIVNMSLIKAEDNKQYYKSYLDIIMKLIPIFALSIIFVYMPIAVLSSIGMAMFWGIALILAYNVAITKYLVN